LIESEIEKRYYRLIEEAKEDDRPEEPKSFRE